MILLCSLIFFSLGYSQSKLLHSDPPSPLASRIYWSAAIEIGTLSMILVLFHKSVVLVVVAVNIISWEFWLGLQAPKQSNHSGHAWGSTIGGRIDLFSYALNHNSFFSCWYCSLQLKVTTVRLNLMRVIFVSPLSLVTNPNQIWVFYFLHPATWKAL